MSCFDNYITLDSSTTSRSGLYASDLPGIDEYMLDGIAKNIATTPDEDHDDIFTTIYKRATRGLVSDAGKQMNKDFHVNLKLVTRETSSFKETNNSNTGLAGVTLEYKLPKYARVHILSVGVYSATAYAIGVNNGQVFKIYQDDDDGDVLWSANTAVLSGKNTFNVDQDFEADKIFIGFDPAVYSFRETENRYFRGYNYLEFGPVLCNECLYGDPDFVSSVVQENGGGLNVKYQIYCSIEKYVCENLNLFQDALLYKIGHEITIERRLGERLTKYTVLSQERWEELEEFYKTEYEKRLMNAINGDNVHEDPFCFACKDTVRTETLLP